MKTLIARLSRWWQARRQRQGEEALSMIKARYQTFRTLLDTNTRAVELITDLNMRLTAGEMGGAFRDKARDLSRVVGEMAERFAALEGRQHHLVGSMHLRLATLLAQELDQLPTATTPASVIPLADVAKHGPSLCGAKAANLARFHADPRFPIPAGFVITAPGCRLFLDHNDLALHAARILGPVLHSDDQAALVAACTRLRERIREAPIPPGLSEEISREAAPFWHRGHGLAVRSSAIAEDGRSHSFAGQFATVLNVTDQAQLDHALREVLASAFSPRAISYRRHAGLSPLAFDMAVLCLVIVPARSAGIIITEDPGGGDTYLISAVLGMGEAAVGGSAAADIFHLSRQGVIDAERTIIARKEHRLVPRIGGGIGLEPVPAAEQRLPAVSATEVAMLASWATAIAAEAGNTPQDIEWVIGTDNQPYLLQARPLPGADRRPPFQAASGLAILISGCQTANRGKAAGRVRLIKQRADLDLPANADPLVLVLSQSLPDAARLLPKIAAVVVELGNPADHLANVARENAIPMLCAATRAGTTLRDGQWVLVDGDEGCVRACDPESAATYGKQAISRAAASMADPLVERFRGLLTRLNLTDAYGPSFNVLECRSLHDIVRFIHEKAVIAMFADSDSLLAESDWLVHHLQVDAIPFLLAIIDLGGALLPGLPRKVQPEAIIAPPFRALWQGIATPGLHWGPPPGGGAVGQVFSRFLTDHQSDRPIGMPNYVIAGRDYLNLNARMDFHFIMVDAVASLDPRANHIRFRFKGGGTSATQRARRVRCIAEILEANGFFTHVRDDLIGADLVGAPHQVIVEQLVTIGRLLGYTRLLDAAMGDDAMAHRAALAFAEGDYGMGFLGRMKGE
jgi:pyruvate,water dikinase